jgi:ribosomal protein S18 acetylase RimI-like enzyme
MIRPARPEDVEQIAALVVELATFERAAHEAQATPEQLHEALFAANPAVFCLVAVEDAVATEDAVAEEDAHVVGFALWFLTFSTWLGRHGIYLEDLFVQPAARRRGHGRALLTALAAIASDRGYRRMEWAVLDWNVEAQEFYRSIGASPMNEWTTWRLTGPALPTLASPATAQASGPRG